MYWCDSTTCLRIPTGSNSITGRQGCLSTRAKLFASPGQPTNFIATTAGMTGSAEPDWSTSDIQDGEVHWRPFTGRWIVKNNFELKHGDRVLFMSQRSRQNVGRITTNTDQPQGREPASKMQPRRSGLLLRRTENILIRSNVIRSAPAAWKGSTDGGIIRNWTIENNLFFDIDNQAYGSELNRRY